MTKYGNVSINTPKPIQGLCFVILGLFMLLALIDYQPLQSNFYQLSSETFPTSGNRLGYLGTYFSFYLCRYLGGTTWLLPVYTLWTGILFLLGRQHKINKKKLICFVIGIFFCSTLLAFFQTLHWLQPHYQFYSAGLGGFIGMYLYKTIFHDYLGTVGSGLVLIPITYLTLALSFASLEHIWTYGLIIMRWLLKKQKNIFRTFIQKIKQKSSSFSLPSWKFTHIRLSRFYTFLKAKKNSSAKNKTKQTDSSQKLTPSDLPEQAVPTYTKETSIPEANDFTKPTPQAPIENTPATDTNPSSNIQILASEVVEKSKIKMPSKMEGYKLPTLDLLKDPPPVLHNANTDDYYETANDLVQKLAEFGVEVKVEAIQSGPVITRYEVTPARGVRVEKITTLDKNIALGLKALSVRIQAPVPGKGCVGIEIPNKKPLPVCLKEILASKAWVQSDAEIPIVLGKEVTGKPIIADLTKMPHLLIAGSTGSGKTVCINTIIASLLFRASPKDLRFIMVDPKIVEMKIYNDLPHMLIPVVTDPKRVPSALKWLIAEMERRYQLFADYGARNIIGFNEKLKKMSANDLATNNLQHLPYIVCVIDELADLMMVAPGDIETCIARLAQLARAAGIHLIIATQRPSVNVITGIIKANLPSRIAFKVASKVDSRTILDTGGADSLIGKGDMLFIPPGASQLIRAQGAWVSDDEITDLVEFLKCNGAPKFAEDVQQMIENEAEESSEISYSDDEDDELIPQALDVLKSSERISTSLLQRRLKIGYNRAARIMETLDARGLIPKNME